MKKLYSFFLVIALTSSLKGQTLNSAHFASPGDVYNYFYTDTLAIVAGPGGTGQIWNFEDLNVSAVLQTDSFIGPIVTNPPIANQTCVSGDTVDGYNFFQNTATAYTMLGLSDSANATTIAYSNPMTLITFPFSYDSTSTDNFAFDLDYQGNNVNVTGTINTIADGTGNLLLPQGAFNNVLRVKYTAVGSGTVLIFTVTQTQEVYEWFDGNYKFPLLHIEKITTTDPFGGLPTVEKVIWVKATGPAGIKTSKQNLDFNLSPNPAHEQVNVKLNTMHNEKTRIAIRNSIGQLVYENDNVDGQLSNLNISTSDLEKGVYFVTLIQNNNTSTKKLVVQ